MASSLEEDHRQKDEFRWPTRGDIAFKPAADWYDNAFIAKDFSSRLALMTSGYKRGADLMVEKAKKSRADRDFLVFPVIFCYRQFIELSLKAILSLYGRSVGIQENWQSHDLLLLWREFELLLAEYQTQQNEEADGVVKLIIAEFSKIDPSSFSHRYPVDKKGNPLPVEQELLDLAALADVMNAVEGFFTGCDGYFDHLNSSM